MLTRHIALVAAAGGVNLSDLARVSAALQKQATNDFGPLWGVTATVDGFPQLEDVPTGYWPIIVGLSDLGFEAGVHVDDNGQPYALVELTAGWSFEASRACLEMLINPSGDRTVTAASPRDDRGLAEFVVEVCGPCGDPIHAYPVNGILVSDFCTPAYYGVAAPTRDRVTFRDALGAPFELPHGGRLVWRDAITNAWWLRIRSQDEIVDLELGIAEHGIASVRELVRARDPHDIRAGAHAAQLLEDRTRLLEHHESIASRARAYRLRGLLAKRLLRAPERAPMLLTEQRARAVGGGAPIGILPQERIERAPQVPASWVDFDPESAPEPADAPANRARVAMSDDRGLMAPRIPTQTFWPAAPAGSDSRDAGTASSAAGEVAQLAPAQFPSIAPVLSAVQPVDGGGEQRLRWLGGIALAAAALFVAFGLGGRFHAGSAVRSQRSPAPAPTAASAPAPQVAPPARPEPASAAAPAPAAGQPSSAAASGVSLPSPEMAEVRVEITDPEEHSREKRQRTASGNASAEQVGARRKARSVEDLIETRR